MNVNLLPGISSTAAALNAERTRLEIVSQNIANAHVSHGPDGKPYQRQVVVFESVLERAGGGSAGAQTPSLRVAGIRNDTRPPQTFYQPGHPDADARGMVTLPNINIHEEMADLITATRAYEANLAAAKNARNMAVQTLAIGKH
jgi:flagellar basal-body rod protein FlgC